MLARFDAELNPPPDAVPSAAEVALQELINARQQLIEQRTVLLQQESQHLSRIVRRLDRARLKLLQRQIAQIELAIGSILEEQSALKQKVERLQQVKGIDFVTAVTCVALCPELGSLSKRQTAALVGVAPYHDDSGARKGWRHIAGGRPKLLRARYMAAISAIRSNPILRRFYQQLRQRNKPSKVALVAVIRKLAILLNHMLRNPSFSRPAKHSCYNSLNASPR